MQEINKCFSTPRENQMSFIIELTFIDLSLSPIFSSTNTSVIYQPEVSIEATDYYQLVMNIYSGNSPGYDWLIAFI